jgi:uncharacterized glyoxalase superfamily protein PhnB
MKLYTYLNYGGNCAQAFRVYEEHLGGKVTMMMTHGERPRPPVPWGSRYTESGPHFLLTLYTSSANLV